MKKQKYKIWLGLLIALFLGSVGSLDQVWCFEAGGRHDPQHEAGSLPAAPEPLGQCAGCSDSPAILGSARSGPVRVQSASCAYPQGALADFLYETRLRSSGYSGDLFSKVSSTIFSSFTFLRTVVLLI
jgi:hypothetical protein